MVNIIDFLPDLLNTTLFDGGQLELSKLILCAIIIFMTALPLLFFNVSINQLMAFEILIIFVLTGLGWLNVAVMIILVVIFALSLSQKITDIFIGNKGV